MAERLAQAVDMINQKLKAGSRVDRRQFFHFCLIYSKFIDVTLAANQNPVSSKEMLLLMKQILTQKDDLDVRPAVIALLLSFKAAYRAGWFTVDESAEVLTVANSLLEPYHPVTSAAPSDSLIIFVGNILSRFYPWLCLDKVFLSLEMEIGHKAQMSDFNMPSLPERMRFFTVNKARLDSPLCLSVPSASFMLNGYGIERRTANTGDLGCQPPADCGRQLRKGPNILQIVGEFQAPYTVLIASVIKCSPKISPTDLPEAQPLCSHSDDDLIEGPSIVSLICPLSRNRIINPVKGAACNHLQCFDFSNYLEMNFKRPSWRCPYCCRVVTSVDLRFDKKMAEILAKVDVSVNEVMISSDGSWRVSCQQKDAPNQAEVVELTETENDNHNADFRTFNTSPTFVLEPRAPDVEDSKPFVSTLPEIFQLNVPAHRLGILPRLQLDPGASTQYFQRNR